MTVDFKRDGYHAAPCRVCMHPTYRRGGICKRCEAEATFDPAKLSETMLRKCVDEYLRRYADRCEALAKIGIVRVA